MDAPPERFYVFETRGYGLGGGTTPPSSSFVVLDRAFAHREVATFYSTEGGNETEASRRDRATARAAELNAV